MTRIIALFFITICLSIGFVSCKKDKFLTDPSATLNFSQDSILFDTVFTTIGSTTRNIRVINKHKQKINISSVRLEKGQSSNFFLNVDGTPGRLVQDVEILANDSIYIFVQVNVNPTNIALSPLIIQDKIVFDINGNEQSVKLEAWGQNAHYHLPNQSIQYKNGFLPYSTIADDTVTINPLKIVSITNTVVTWGGGTLGNPDDNRPHVVYGWLVVDSTQKLVINAGVKVYFHQNAGLWVYRYGTLQVNGTAGNEVVFQGDRREADYADMPGQWDRIWINEGHTDNYINYAIIKNNFIGVQASILSNPNQPTKLKLTNTIIKNCSKWGLFTQYFSVWSGNNVIANCKEYCAAITMGGNCTFLHTTFANYYNQDGGRGGQSCVYVGNNDGTQDWPIDSMYFANSIIDGSQAAELEMAIESSTLSPGQLCKVTNCLIKGSIPTTTLITNTNNVFNGNADFSNPSGYDFKIGQNSAAKTLGDQTVITPYFSILGNDLSGTGSRLVPPISAGAYQ